MKEKKDNATVKLLESQSKWTSFAKDILAISKELFKAIHTLQTHGQIPLEFLEMSSARIQKYEAFLNESEMTFRHSAAEDADQEPGNGPEEVVPEESLNQSQGQSQTQFRMQQQKLPLAALDYNKIKACMRSSKDEAKTCALLQALKLRLLKSQKGRPRKQLIHWFITYDLLGCGAAEDTLLERLLHNPSKKVVEFALVLLNMMATYGQGIDYIISRELNVRLLLEMLYTEVPILRVME